MDPSYFLKDKTKEKLLAKEMKNKYDTKRGSRGIIIKHIIDVTTIMAKTIMACNLIIKCHEDEVSVGVVIATAQCAEGTTRIWAPYFLNLFLDDCKDA
jgi:hypothetical protein